MNSNKIIFPDGVYVHQNKKKSIIVKFNEKLKDYIDKTTAHIYVYALLIIVAYIFYQFGYAFCYAYYFGGSNSAFSSLDLFINQVPFDFKFIALVGIVILVSCITYIVPLIMVFYGNKFHNKMKWLLMNLVSGAIIFFIIFLISGMDAHGYIYDRIAGLLLSTSAVSLFAISIYKPLISSDNMEMKDIFTMYRKLIFNLVYIGLIIWANISVVEWFDFDLSELRFMSLYSIFALEAIFIIMLYNYMFLSEHRFINLKNSLLVILYEHAFYVIGAGLLLLAKRNKLMIITTLIVVLAYKIIYKRNYFKLSLINKIKAYKSKKGIQNSCHNKPNISSGINENTTKVILFLLLSLFGLILFIFVQKTVYDIGNAFGEIAILNNESRIDYYVDSEGKINKTVHGVLVVHKDNEYYISTEERGLQIIKSQNTIIVNK